MLSLLCLAALVQTHPGVSSTIKTLYVVEMSHLDIGFTAPPSVVERESYRHLLDALGTADSWPDFRWTIESAWQLQEFDERATPNQRQRLRNRFAQGSFVLGAGYLNPHSGLWGEEQLHRFPWPAHALAASYGARRDSALLDDVPGFTLAMPRVLAQAGVNYALLGANNFIGGEPAIPLADRPFWWEARDGSRVLTWLTYASYAEGYDAWGLWTVNQMLNRLSQRLPEYEAAGYPYDAVLVMRGFDNAGSSAGMANLAQQWNANYDNPKVKLATPAEFFEYLLQKYGDVFPTYHGDAAGMWESGVMGTPATTSLVRRARASLPDLEALYSAFHAQSAAAYPAAELDHAWRQTMVFDEHSGGGASWPGYFTITEVQQQNREFVAVATDCAAVVASLRDQAMDGPAADFVPAGTAGLVLFNPLGSPFSGVVEVECGAPQAADLRLVDPAGGPDPVFRWIRADRSGLAFRADLPARGWRRYELAGGGSAPPPPGAAAGFQMQHGWAELELDPATGTVIRLVDLSSGSNLVDASSPHLFAGAERGTNQQVFFSLWEPYNLSPVSALVEDPGPVYRSLRVYGPGGFLFREYRLFSGETRLDVISFVPRKLPYVPYDKHSHHYGLTFPVKLALPVGLAVDGPDGWYEPGLDSLPGAALGHFACATGARLTGADGRWISMSTPDDPILDLGEMTGAAGASVETDENSLTVRLAGYASEVQVSGGGIASFVAEPGMPAVLRHEQRLRFGDAGSAPPDRELLRRDLSPPFAAWVAQGRGPAALAASAGFLDLQGPAELVGWKRSWGDDGYVLRLRAGPAGGAATVTPPRAPSSAALANLLEEPQAPLSVNAGAVTVPLAPGGVVTVLLRD